MSIWQILVTIGSTLFDRCCVMFSTCTINIAARCICVVRSFPACYSRVVCCVLFCVSVLQINQDRGYSEMQKLSDENQTLRNRLRDVVHSPLSDTEKQQIIDDSQRLHSSAPASIALPNVNTIIISVCRICVVNLIHSHFYRTMKRMARLASHRTGTNTQPVAKYP